MFDIGRWITLVNESHWLMDWIDRCITLVIVMIIIVVVFVFVDVVVNVVVIDVEAWFTLFIKHSELWNSLFDVVWMLIVDVVINIFLELFLSFFYILCLQKIPFHLFLVHVKFLYHKNFRNDDFRHLKITWDGPTDRRTDGPTDM